MRQHDHWFLVPLWFGIMLFLTWATRWLPQTLDRLDTAFGQGQVIAWHLQILWQAAMRAGVVLAVTPLAFLLLPPIRRMHALYLAIGAVAAEILVELLLIQYVPALGQVWQLLVTAGAYSIVLVVSRHFMTRAIRNGVYAA